MVSHFNDLKVNQKVVYTKCKEILYKDVQKRNINSKIDNYPEGMTYVAKPDPWVYDTTGEASR